MFTIAETSTMTLVLWIGIMIAAVFVATVAVLVFRKKLLSGEATPSGPMLMSDLRRLQASGKLTEQEFAQLSARLAGRLKAGGTPTTRGEAPTGHQPQPSQIRPGRGPTRHPQAE